MCRIAGILEYETGEGLEEKIIGMRDSLAHGGPDDAGLFICKEKGLALGHRRLSIIDLSPQGHQPMSNGKGTLWLSYNGEIYNYLSLKEELKNRNHHFRTSTDTEVIIKAYEEWGELSFSRLCGMFAFSLYDRDKSLLYLVRDHAGIKPLYYAPLKNSLVFASELRAFKKYDRSWQENSEWRIFFLSFGHIPEPFTVLKDVYMLPAGSFLQVSLADHTMRTHVFENILVYSETNKDEQEAVLRVRELFSQSVKRHLISDAPIGVFLSGGIDSSLISLVAHRTIGEDLTTISIVFEEEEFSEKNYQQAVTQKIKTKHTECVVTRNTFNTDLELFFHALDQPTVDGINTFFISRYAHEAGLKAVLSGTGGDELFGGYPTYQMIEKVWFLRNSPSFLSDSMKFFGSVNHDRLEKLSYLAFNTPLGYYLFFRALFSPFRIAEILDTSEKEVTRVIEKILVEDPQKIGKKNFVSYLESSLYLRNQLLRDCDVMSMSHGLELRVPFLDRDLMSYVFSVSEKIKFSGKTPKHLIAKAFEDLLPEEVVCRKKAGFTFPFQKWLHKNLPEFCVELSSKSAHIIEKFKAGKLHWSRFWALYVMERYSRKKL